MIATNSHPSVVWNILIKVRMVTCTGRPCCLVMYTLSTKNDATINLENAYISAIILSIACDISLHYPDHEYNSLSIATI